MRCPQSQAALGAGSWLLGTSALVPTPGGHRDRWPPKPRAGETRHLPVACSCHPSHPRRHSLPVCCCLRLHPVSKLEVSPAVQDWNWSPRREGAICSSFIFLTLLSKAGIRLHSCQGEINTLSGVGGGKGVTGSLGVPGGRPVPVPPAPESIS